jgi:DNA-binding CsgD family transcriptional regulator
MTHIRKFIEWLSFHPSCDEIARALVTEYLAAEGVCSIRFGRINNDDSAIVLGEYGFADAAKWGNRVIPGIEWRNSGMPEVDIITGKNKTRWSSDPQRCVVSLRDRGVIQGHSVVEFANPVSDFDKPRVLEVIEDFCLPIALFISFQNRAAVSTVSSINAINDLRNVGPVRLTQRQILILGGMVEGKTNHELAIELGYSVSTIRHETMRIYQALSVSDRKEAAKKALVLAIV